MDRSLIATVLSTKIIRMNTRDISTDALVASVIRELSQQTSMELATDGPDSTLAIVLCVRVLPKDVPSGAIDGFRNAYPHHLIRMVYVNPATPEELDEMTEWPDVVVVYLQEQPLPKIVLQKMNTPCVLLRDGQLMQLTQIMPSLQPFEVSVAAEN